MEVCLFVFLSLIHLTGLGVLTLPPFSDLLQRTDVQYVLCLVESSAAVFKVASFIRSFSCCFGFTRLAFWWAACSGHFRLSISAHRSSFTVFLNCKLFCLWIASMVTSVFFHSNFCFFLNYSVSLASSLGLCAI